jgi:excisionase family DNA binding protein
MPEFLTTQDAHEQTGYTIQHLIRLLKEGKIEGKRFGRLWAIDPDSLQDYLEQARVSDDGRRGPRKSTGN